MPPPVRWPSRWADTSWLPTRARVLLAVAAAYAGLVWLARQLGVRSWMAHAPAIAFVTSAYYVTNIYARGAWTEFMATSTIPLLVASACRLARAQRIAPLPAVLFVISTVLLAARTTSPCCSARWS